MNELALCSGIGGLSLGIKRAWKEARTICHVEREAYAAAVLVKQMEEGALAPAPIWSDLASFDGNRWRKHVHLVSSGIPCQPFSLAGKRLGTSDPRWLWPQVVRILHETQPSIFFMENVPEIRKHGLEEILCGLAVLGFDAQWSVFSAAASGAPHIRKRFFLMARHPDRKREPTLTRYAKEVGRLPELGTDPYCERLWEKQRWLQSRGPRTTKSLYDGEIGDPPNSDFPGLENWQGKYRHVVQEQQAAFGVHWRSVGPGLHGSSDGSANRVDRIRATGNAVVPQVAERAWHVLFRRLARGVTP